MCTVTWIPTDTGFELFVNRDERRGRGRAEVPRLFRGQAVRYLAPIDSDAGGTWTAVGDQGLAATLLNFYDAPNPPEIRAPRSRGWLIPQLIQASDAEHAAAALGALELSRFRPFTLLFVSATAEIGGTTANGIVIDWDGHTLERQAESGRSPLSSSGGDAARARRTRRRLFEALPESREALEPAHLLEFHRCHLPQRGADSPCMHRAEARTVSMSRITVGSLAVSIAYADGPPCRTTLDRPLALERRR